MRAQTMPDSVPQKDPYVVRLLASYRYAWCACGLSKMQPWCDGSHTSSKTGILPTIWVQEDDKTVALCGCKHTSKPPRCDGSHKRL